ncbi:hypothetical protein GP486_004629 [Trichoglossum hirsutum]|uniref:Partial AB-hydrolase lipase domain-containing protein n=1 Tax=Trichoglossum hirsutum TaxID=265104 RepID=A0A9P8LB12_9PEZI|nr:hypothetical protein GP486_004629 [Trichoglossum hirsutum]
MPLSEAERLNRPRDQNDRIDRADNPTVTGDEKLEHEPEPLRRADTAPQSSPLFPPLPLYNPPTLPRNIQYMAFRVSSFFLSLLFLAVITLGAIFKTVPLMFIHIGTRLRGNDPNACRPLHEEEQRRSKARKAEVEHWKRKEQQRRTGDGDDFGVDIEAPSIDGFEPKEGGKDKLICDAGYYARRVGLDVEEFKVETEDGFLIALWHVYDPKEHSPASSEAGRSQASGDFQQAQTNKEALFTAGESPWDKRNKNKYPVLLMHGLLQSAGAYCTNDDDSLAFFLCKSGYDVWLGNNRCGFKPEHTLFSCSDPRMWAWNILQLGVLDLPAFVSRVLSETGFEKLGLVCHSQGTAETFVALAKEQLPDLGEKISVFCALAPAVYAGPLVGRTYLKFMRIIPPGLFRIVFGIHAFIPLMMVMHAHLPRRLYGALGYRVFSFLFGWTDERWDLELRDRQFLFAPIYVSAECMQWWLGRECFAKQKCILATKEEWKLEEAEDKDSNSGGETSHQSNNEPKQEGIERRLPAAWYNEQFPPLALWIAGSDGLVDGRRLLRRLEQGREPHVRLVHANVIEEYEHLDVLWAIDSVEKVATEVREVIWKTLPEDIRNKCRVPKGLSESGRPPPSGQKKPTHHRAS